MVQPHPPLTPPPTFGQRLALSLVSVAKYTALAARGKKLQLVGGKLFGAKLLALSTSAAAFCGAGFVWLGDSLVRLGERMHPPPPADTSARSAPPPPPRIGGGAPGGPRSPLVQIGGAVAAAAVAVALTELHRRLRRAPPPPRPLQRQLTLDVDLLEAELAKALQESVAAAAAARSPTPPAAELARAPTSRFLASELVFGPPEDAALGVLHFMNVTRNGLPLPEGTAAIEREVRKRGSWW